MRNLKHTTAAIAAVVMIGSLAVSQVEDLKKSYRNSSLLSAAASNSVVVEENSLESGAKRSLTTITVASEEEVQAELTEQYTQEELDKIYAEKSISDEAYVILTSGVLTVREQPSLDSEKIDSLEKNTTIEILESTEDWYKVRYNGDKTGYVIKSNITQNKEDAETAAKYFDNFRYGKVKTNGGSIRIRKGPSTSSEILGELENGTQVLLLTNDNDFVKVCYGEDYLDGYIIASALEVTDSWLPKPELAVKKQEVADRKAREKAEREAKEKAEREAKEKAEREAKEKSEREAKEKAAAQKKAKSSNSSTPDTPSTNAATSSKGQAIVNSAKKYLGVKYVYGGSSPSGFDCSGLVQYVFRQNGLSISRTSASQARQGKSVSKSDLQPGDLLFFAKNGRVHHVGIYAGNGQMIHAPHTGDVVKYSSINTAYRQKEFYCAKRFY